MGPDHISKLKRASYTLSSITVLTIDLAEQKVQVTSSATNLNQLPSNDNGFGNVNDRFSCSTRLALFYCGRRAKMWSKSAEGIMSTQAQTAILVGEF